MRCSSTSEIVWARLHGFPWWPALVVKPDGAGFQVCWTGRGGEGDWGWGQVTFFVFGAVVGGGGGGGGGSGSGIAAAVGVV